MGPAVLISRNFPTSPKYSSGTCSRRMDWMATDIRTKAGRNAALRSAGIDRQPGDSVGKLTFWIIDCIPLLGRRYCPEYTFAAAILRTIRGVVIACALGKQ